MSLHAARRAVSLALLLALATAAPPAAWGEREAESSAHRAREALTAAIQAEPPFPAQRELVARLRAGVAGIGTARAIMAGERHAGDRVPVYLKDGSALFLTVDPAGRLLEGLTLPLPPSRLYLLPAEWLREREIPLHLPAAWVDPEPLAADPLFPVLACRRGALTEYVGLPVDPAALEGFFILPDAATLPAKNVEEEPAFIADLRELAGFSRARHRPEPRQAPLLSMEAAAATVVDWWRAQTSGSDEVRFDRHRNRFSGRAEYGCDFWEIRARLLAGRAEGAAAFPRFAGFPDPVLGEEPLAALEPVARAIARREPTVFTTFPPFTGGAATREALLPACLGAVKLFDGHAGDLARLRGCLEAHGPLLAASAPRVEGLAVPHSLFGFAVVGCGSPGGVPCVLYRDVYGDGDPGRADDASGGPALRVLPLALVREAWCFPHELALECDVDWRKPALVARVRVRGGGPVDPTELAAVFENEKLPVSFARVGPGHFEGALPKRALAHDRPVFRVRARKRFLGAPGDPAAGAVEIRHTVK